MAKLKKGFFVTLMFLKKHDYLLNWIVTLAGTFCSVYAAIHCSIF
jgi:hypothetical protein